MNNTMKRYAVCLVLFVLLSGLPLVGANSQTEEVPGYYLVHWYTYDGAEVCFDDEYKGTIRDSELVVPVDPAALPYRRYSITKEGHATFTGYIDSVPAPGETMSLHPWYVQTEQPEPEGVDDDRGWYVVHESKSREGSSVYFDRTYMGEITNGTLRVEVNLTEPAFTEYRVVEPDGWTSHTMFIQQIPPTGGTVHYYAWVQPAPRPPPMLPGPDTPESIPVTPAARPENTTDDEGVKTPGFGITVLIAGLVITACAVRRW